MAKATKNTRKRPVPNKDSWRIDGLIKVLWGLSLTHSVTIEHNGVECDIESVIDHGMNAKKIVLKTSR